jgi:hypothetical protein
MKLLILRSIKINKALWLTNDCFISDFVIFGILATQYSEIRHMQHVKRIALWSGPRNVSTALMYAFAQRADAKVIDEPLFGYFLKHTGLERPSRAEVLSTMETDAAVIIQKELMGSCGQPVLFMKHMANHLTGLDWSFIHQFTNVILTRDPEDMLPSYAQHVKTPTLLDTAYGIQTELLDYLIAHQLQPIVLDSKEILSNPEVTLKRFCEQIEIPFDDKMLTWEKGPRKEDGIWAKYWYNNVHNSTGFAPYKKKITPFPEHLKPILAECKPHYDRLISFTI